MRILIALSGKLGSGKDYVASHLIIPEICKKYRYLHCSFADQLKINVMTKHSIEYKELYEEKSHSTRKLLQTEGTEIARSQDPNIWIKYLDNWIQVHNSRGVEVFIVTDLRFSNELDYVKNFKEFGISIRVKSKTRNHSRLLQESGGDEKIYDTLKNHRSECDLDDREQDFDMVIDNDGEDLFRYSEIFRDLIKRKIRCLN